ncbi:nucleotide disphospho-sugar-binding domain-containing protein [Streptomyces montanisoli]|uniref:nucleotide disphospho-sugar-binding domain-containing protein n=1 Tax=Streptomyces montanisoli TaxID=2798581 RepID=UPI001FD83AAB|nr:nucleotide disphospho-sugar-binding domain-containing protein [Streptomyces montanisoli]
MGRPDAQQHVEHAEHTGTDRGGGGRGGRRALRVLFAVSDWPGHWHAMVPLGWALRAAGHDVRVVCAPSQTEPLTRAGLTPVPILDGGWDMALQGRLQNYVDARDGQWRLPGLPPHPVTGEPLASLDEFDMDAWFTGHHPRLVEAATGSTDRAVAFGRAWRPDLVVHERFSLEGPLVAGVLGVPSAVHLWGPCGPDDSEPGFISLPLDFSGAFDRYGLPPLTARTLTHVIDPSPAGVAPPLLTAERMPVRYVPYNGPGSAPPDLPGPSGRPRVCVVWGTSLTRMYGPASFAVPEALAGLADLDAEVVVAVTGADRERLGTVPPNARVVGHTPLHLLLPSCAAVVHHGGAGVVMTSLAAGVPQLAVSHGLDQAVNARRVAGAGAGRVVEAP